MRDPRVLIAGVGNVLRGDDGFGVALLRELGGAAGGWPGVRLFETGIAGIEVVQQLFDGYDALIILDAVDRGAAPGTLFVLEPDAESLGARGATGDPIDLHQADPEAALRMAAALGVLPPHAWIVGCQAAQCDELGAGLSPEVRAALPAAAARVAAIVHGLAGAAGTVDSVRDLAAADEVLQVMYWMRGERLASAVEAADLLRFVSIGVSDLTQVFDRLQGHGLVARIAGAPPPRFALTPEGAREAARRFADEFADMTRPGHGECGDPDCDCHRTGSAEDCRHKARQSLP